MSFWQENMTVLVIPLSVLARMSGRVVTIPYYIMYVYLRASHLSYEPFFVFSSLKLLFQ